MEWIKKNYDQFILILVALLLLGMSAKLILNARSFQEVFEGIQDQGNHSSKLPPVNMAGLNQANESLREPARWTTKKAQGSLLVSEKYTLKDGALVRLDGSGVDLHPPIPNKWFVDNGLDILSSNALTDDADGDGFTNLDEWKGLKGDGSDSTDPNNKSSHPPYWTKLRLERFIREQFRLLFPAYEGEPDKPDTLTFQINAVDAGQPTQFLKLNDMVAGTKFKISKFQYKTIDVPGTGGKKDVSELTLQNTETGTEVVLIIEQITNSPDSYALFRYTWNNTQFKVQKNKTFAIKPEEDVIYKVLDINDNEAVIQNTKTNEQNRVSRLEQP